MALIAPSRRVRRTPFSDGVIAAGVKGYTVYNHLKSAVQVWDVSCERQVEIREVEIRGPDAGRLVQMLTPRNLSEMQDGQCFYVPMVDETGVPPCDRAWPLMDGNLQVGQVTSAANSPDFATGVGIGMVRMTHRASGTELDVITPDGARAALVHETFWI